jgi:peptidoglycan hydrolase-like protein with peptidoglycan-binding domain
MSILKKSIALVAGVAAGAMVFAAVAAPAPAQAQTSAELQAEIQNLLAMVANLQAQLSGGSTTAGTSYNFTADLTIGSRGADVTALQNFLIANGQSIPAGATGYFGAQTQAALAAYQAANGIAPAAGYFGPITRAKVNASGTVTVPGGSTDDGDDDDTDTDTDSGDLEGGAGSLSDVELISSLNNEEVGEDEEDAKVAGIEIEADGSDIELRAVTLNFNQTAGGTSEDFDEYASEVSIWFDGEEVARVDAEEFEDDDEFNGTISFDSGAIIREGDTGELVVAISGLSNIDSDEIGDEWSVGFESVRFADSQNAVITDSSTGDLDGTLDDTVEAGDANEREFTFESFATASDVELRISAGDDEINDSRTIIVDDSDETNDEEILSFNAEVEGDSDLMVEDIVVEFTVTGASNLDDLVTDITLMMDGEEVGSENVPTDDETVTFDNLDLELAAGDEYEFVVVVDLLGTDDNLDEGDSISAKVTDTETDAWDVEDESGENLGDDEKTGSATGEAHTVYENGIMVEAVSTDQDANDDETVGTFTIVVDVTAFGEDQYVHELANSAASSTDAGFYYTIYKGGAATSTDMATSSLVTTTADEDGEYYVIDEGTTERFTIQVTVNPNTGGEGIYNVELDEVRFDPDNAADSASTDDTFYTVPSSEDVQTQGENLVASA